MVQPIQSPFIHHSPQIQISSFLFLCLLFFSILFCIFLWEIWVWKKENTGLVGELRMNRDWGLRSSPVSFLNVIKASFLVKSSSVWDSRWGWRELCPPPQRDGFSQGLGWEKTKDKREGEKRENRYSYGMKLVDCYSLRRSKSLSVSFLGCPSKTSMLLKKEIFLHQL